MADRSVRRLCAALAVGCLLAGAAVWAAGPRPAGGSPSGSTIRVLQFNLCDSAIAGCFTGRAVDVAAGVIRSARPAVVTLNEVCRHDVTVLARAMSAASRDAPVASGFGAAVDRRTGEPFRCLNGEQYGVGVLALRGSATSGYRTYGGVYPVQDLGDPEERVWLCVAEPALFACTTHTASTSTAVALTQCRFLLGSALPMVRAQPDRAPLILGADLNLPASRSPGPQSCLPTGFQRADDGSRQDVVTSPELTVGPRTVIDMQGATDHPGLLVDLIRS